MPLTSTPESAIVSDSARVMGEEGWVQERDEDVGEYDDEETPLELDKSDGWIAEGEQAATEETRQASENSEENLDEVHVVEVVEGAEKEEEVDPSPAKPSWQDKHRQRVVFDESKNMYHLGNNREELRRQSTRYYRREDIRDARVLQMAEKEAEEAEIKKVKAARRHTPAHNAADQGNVPLLQEIGENSGRSALLAPNQFGRTPVDFAASGGHLEALQFLYEAVPESFTATDDQGWNAAHVAAVHGHAEVLRYLHQVEPELLTAVDNANRVPADYGAQQGYEWVHVVLAELGADIPVPKKKGYNPDG